MTPEAFACAAINRVRAIVNALSIAIKGHSQFCTLLDSRLMSLEAWLNEHDRGGQKEMIGKILSLLQNLCDVRTTIYFVS